MKHYNSIDYTVDTVTKFKTALTFDDVHILPKYSEVVSRTTLNGRTKFTKRWYIDIPLIAAPMDTVCELDMAMAMARLGGVGVIHRFMPIEEQAKIVSSIYAVGHDAEGHPTIPIAAAIGVTEDSLQRAENLITAGATVLVIDVAHGHHENVRNMMTKLAELRDRMFMGYHAFDIVAGSIATGDAAYDLIQWGADALRVGVGGGSVCETRVRTGIGVPQLQAVLDAVDVANQFDIPVISDGGIRYPGDAAKALAAGADSVMIGSLFAGTDEAPGEYFVEGQWPNDKKMKMYRGLASKTTKLKHTGLATHVEGASKLIPIRGPVNNVVSDILDGIYSSMSYVGASTIAEFQHNAEFIHITPSGLAEAHPHGLR